jgi:hypothetical protein
MLLDLDRVPRWGFQCLLIDLLEPIKASRETFLVVGYTSQGQKLRLLVKS